MLPQKHCFSDLSLNAFTLSVPAVSSGHHLTGDPSPPLEKRELDLSSQYWGGLHKVQRSAVLPEGAGLEITLNAIPQLLHANSSSTMVNKPGLVRNEKGFLLEEVW